MTILLLVLGGFFVLMNIYFMLAKRFSIVDKPNERSLHTTLIIRGGGVIFYVAVLLFFILNQFSYPCFFLGVSLMALISFWDDVKSVPNRYRISIHVTAVILMLYELDVYYFYSWWTILLIAIVVIGTINAYNFMDGINGITGGYSLLMLSFVSYLNMENSFVNSELLYMLIAALLVFNYYNFRKKARCFAGDVGSISIAFILVFLVLKLILKESNYIYILFFAVYGVDSVLTIIHRLIRKENIFKAHRLHLFQVIVYQKKFSHVLMALIYCGVQALINVAVLNLVNDEVKIQIIGGGAILLMLALVYVLIKRSLLTTTVD